MKRVIDIEDRFYNIVKKGNLWDADEVAQRRILAGCMGAVLRSTPLGSEWIPVSERLPEERKRVLVCDRTTVYMANRHDDWWYFSPAEIGTVVKQSDIYAWMPLPEPYKGEEA